MSAFNDACETTLLKALDTCAQRGKEYQDSWALENLNMTNFEHVWTSLGLDKLLKLSPVQKRLLVIASLCDVKLSRLVGGFKSDTYEDLINYLATLRTWLEMYLEKT